MSELDAIHSTGDARTTESPIPTPADLKAVIEAERTGLPFVHWRAGGDQELRLLGTRAPAPDDRATGRTPTSRWWDTEVSRAHALLELVGGQWTVRRRRPLAQRDVRQWQPRPRSPAVARPRPPVLRTDAGRLPRAARSRARGLDRRSAFQRRRGDALAGAAPDTVALCRPVNDSTSATPATNRQIADEVFLSVDAVKAHLRVLFDRFGVGELPQNEKRARLAAEVLLDGVLKPHDF